MPEDLTPERWAAITEHFGEAIDLPADRRDAFLAALRRHDADLAREVASLLEAHDAPGEPLPEVGLWSPADLMGTSVGAYRLTRLLDEGGTGAVYLAERSDGAFTKEVALKVLSPALLFAQERFRQERDFLARLEHPNVARLLDGGTTPAGLPYLVVEYVEGKPITRHCAERALPLADRLDLLLQLCAAIDHAHQRFIVHSDIKPGNILVTARGTVKVLDFGIATFRGAIRDGVHAATPAYSSPEQLAGQPLTTASDVYAIGVVAYEVLTGRLPYAFRTADFDDVRLAVARVEPDPPSRAPHLSRRETRQLRGDLDHILLRALAKEPARRYTSARQFADDIERHRGGFPVRARPNTVGYRLGRFLGRYRLPSALAAAAVVCVAAAAGLTIWQARVARGRYDDLRGLAHAVVFDVNDALAPIPGTTSARAQVVHTALEYLDRLGRENLSDPVLRQELASAYVRIGKIQGGAFLANLGDSAGAAASFRKAIDVAGRSRATPGLERVAIDAHNNLALLATDPIRALPDFDAAIRAAERRLAVDPDDVETMALMADACHGRATVDHLTGRIADEEAFSTREIRFREQALRRSRHWEQEVALAGALAQHALALEQTGDYPGSVAELDRAAALIDASLTRNAGNQVLTRDLADLRSRRGSVLLAMGRTHASVAALEDAMRLLAPLVAADPGNAQSRGDLAYTWFRLAETLRAQGEVRRALELHERALGVRRARVSHDPSLTFIRWDLSRSLNAVGALRLSIAPRDPQAAAALFDEARGLALASLEAAPSFLELQREVARADEGLGRAALVRRPTRRGDARFFFERSLRTWEAVLARAPEDRRDAGAPDRLRALLASVVP
ncbi:MAG TPA: protein kinase [Vicinamibacterales bacterium]|nr:protein kinase [Vicinamibacterales bacterium]